MSSSSSSLARWLAPLALIACAVAVFAIVKGGSGSGSSGATTTQERTGGTAKKAATTTGRAKRKSGGSARRYTVKPGDTLSAIAAKTGVSLVRLQQLNPELDAQSLQTGQKVKLRP